MDTELSSERKESLPGGDSGCHISPNGVMASGFARYGNWVAVLTPHFASLTVSTRHCRQGGAAAAARSGSQLPEDFDHSDYALNRCLLER